MDHSEMVSLLRRGVGSSGGIWADLGAGQGNFTRALRDLVGAEATIHAVDQDAGALLRNTAADVHHEADFTNMEGMANLPDALDGVLITNALHWTRHQRAVMESIYRKLATHGRLLLVEYEATLPRPFMIPYPVPFTRFEQLAQQAGFQQVRQVATRASPRSGIGMYAAVAIK